MTLVTIFILSYNNNRFVHQTIASALRQTMKDFDIIVIDDCSQDGSYEEIYSKYNNNDRIAILKNEYNSGINFSINRVIKASKAKYLVFMGSDDIMEDNHLEVTVKYLEKNKELGAVYCNHRAIDENNNEIGRSSMPQMNRFEVLKRMFLHGNPLSSPGMIIRKSVMDEIYPLPISICNYQDMVMHVLIAKKYEILVLKEALIRYRKHANNISALSLVTINRQNAEEDFFMDLYIEIDDLDLIKNIFGKEAICKYKNIDKKTIPFILANIALESDNYFKRLWGYKSLYRFLMKKENFNLVNAANNYQFKDLLKSSSKILLTNNESTFKQERDDLEKECDYFEQERDYFEQECNYFKQMSNKYKRISKHLIIIKVILMLFILFYISNSL